SIEDLNAARAKISDLKAGGLGRRLLEKASVRCWVLNDVGPDKERLVGSGPVDCPEIQHEALADARHLAHHAAAMMQAFGHQVEIRPPLTGPVESALATFLDGHEAGTVRIAAGEVTIDVPGDAPRGGRTSHAALLATQHLAPGTGFFAGASDGQDGQTGDAGAWAWPGDDASAARHFDAHAYLATKGQTLRIGSTGNNLNDLWIAF
ncbi:MAG: MOFRL family protein, partial [Thermoplasmatota archaeon]